MLQNALDKKSNIEYLEKEVGLHKFLPKIVIETVKSKNIRKLIQQHFKKFSTFSERDCMFKFLDLLKTVYKFDQERFRCSVGSWSIPVTLVIGPKNGIAYTTDSAVTATHMTEFSHVQSIQTLEANQEKSAHHRGKIFTPNRLFYAKLAIYAKLVILRHV